MDTFTQFALVRLSLVTLGDAMMGSMVVNIVIAHRFLRRRGRAFAISSMGVGFAKVCMPIVAASLIVARLASNLGDFRAGDSGSGVVPALLFIRRSPEEMGLLPDGSEEPVASRVKQNRAATDATTNQDLEWTRAEAMRTRTFWLLVITFGIASVGGQV